MKKILLLLLLLLVGISANAQAYLDDLIKGDIKSFETKVQVLNIDLKTEPVLINYLLKKEPKEAVDFALVKKLLEIGVNPNIVSRSGYTPLDTIASWTGLSPEIVPLLLSSGATLNAQGRGRLNSVVDIAISNRNYRAANYLVKFNNGLPKKNQVSVNTEYNNIVAIIGDKIDDVKKVLASSKLGIHVMWDVAISSSSYNTLTLLMELSMVPPGKIENLNYDLQDILLHDKDLIKFLISKKYNFNIISVVNLAKLDSQYLIDLIGMGFTIEIAEERKSREGWSLYDFFDKAKKAGSAEIIDWLAKCGMKNTVGLNLSK